MSEKTFTWPNHAVLAPPRYEDVERMAAAQERSAPDVMREILTGVRQAIAAESADPLHSGWEPSIWFVCRALLGMPVCYSRAFIAHIRDRFDMDWTAWSGAMREVLGFARPIRMLLIMGGNRSSKSNFAAKCGMEEMENNPGSCIYPMHMSNPRSVRDQQPLFWNYMPPAWRHQSKSTLEYIAYKRKTGFSDSSFIAPNGSECAFLNYQQDRDTAVEGIEANLVLPDELIPVDWLETLPMRLVTRAGKAIVTFTPVNGYTPSVKMFCDSARVAKDGTGYLLPTDGKERCEALALNLEQREYDEIVAAGYYKRTALAMQSRPDDCHAWLEAAGVRTTGKVPGPYGIGNAQRLGYPGRTFERIPRVLQSVDPRKAVVFFWSSDNPYGNPKEVAAETRVKGVGWTRERFYGLAEKVSRSKFPKFALDVHVVEPGEIPEGGTDYMFCDPHGSRNYFMGWIRIVGRNVYVRREWPGGYHVPGIGVPGAWAIPSGKKEGRNDGAPGEGQESFGFGLLRYKFEIARLERWADWREWSKERDGTAEWDDLIPDSEELEGWSENAGAEEVMEARVMDSRAASAPKVEDDRPVTLQTEFDDLLLCFDLAPGKDVATGEGLINAALDFERRDGEWVMRPRLFVSNECPNFIYALENFLGTDGDKGACKEPIDILRWFFTGEYEDRGSRGGVRRGGVSYGRRNGRGSRGTGESRLERWTRDGRVRFR